MTPAWLSWSTMKSAVLCLDDIDYRALLQRPLEQRPPLQSESEPQEPHFPEEQRPSLQSESEPQEPHFPDEQRPWPLQSESEPQEPHFPEEHRP